MGSARILVLGAGKVGLAVGQAWLARGHDVRFAVRDPDDPKHAPLPRERLRRADHRGDADVIVVATPHAAAAEALAALGDLSGAAILDCTNPLGMGPGGLHLTLGHDTSGAEAIAARFPAASVFKTLNQTGAENMADARAYHPRPVMFVAGGDAALKPRVMDLVSDLGFEAVDAGPLAAARLLEPLAMLWIELAMKRGHARQFAFALVRHPGVKPEGSSP